MAKLVLGPPPVFPPPEPPAALNGVVLPSPPPTSVALYAMSDAKRYPGDSTVPELIVWLIAPRESLSNFALKSPYFVALILEKESSIDCEEARSSVEKMSMTWSKFAGLEYSGLMMHA